MNTHDKSSGRKNSFSSFMKRRQLRYGGLATLLIAVFIAVVVLVNVAVGAVENRWALKIDLSATQVTAFSDATFQTLKDLNTDVDIFTVYQPGTQSELRVQVEEVLAKYRTLNNHINLGNIDSVTNPELLKKYVGSQEVSEGAIIVANKDGSRVKVISTSEYSQEQQNQYTGDYYTLFAAEQYVTSAIRYVASDKTYNVYFLSGHKEVTKSSCPVITQELELNNYDVADLTLSSDAVTLKKGDTVVVVAPQTDLLTDEYTKLHDWLIAGGRLMMVYDYNVDITKLVNFKKLLDYYNVSYGEGYVQEDETNTSAWREATYLLVPTMNTDHEIIKNLQSAVQNPSILVRQARPINAVAFPQSGIQYTNILTSSDKAKVVTAEGAGTVGKQILAMTVLDQDYEDSSNDVRIALLDSAYFVYGDASANPFLYGSDDMTFAMKTIDWLSNRESTVSVPAKVAKTNVLSIPDQSNLILLAVIVIGVIPLLVLVAGIVVWARRRRL